MREIHKYSKHQLRTGRCEQSFALGVLWQTPTEQTRALRGIRSEGLLCILFGSNDAQQWIRTDVLSYLHHHALTGRTSYVQHRCACHRANPACTTRRRGSRRRVVRRRVPYEGLLVRIGLQRLYSFFVVVCRLFPLYIDFPVHGLSGTETREGTSRVQMLDV